jgi:septum formation protein
MSVPNGGPDNIRPLPTARGGTGLEAALQSPLVLASASPRRQEMLRLSGLDFEVASTEMEEVGRPAGPPQAHALANARLKALAVAPGFPGRLVIGADTVVALGRVVLEKPAEAAAARRMLEQLSGRRHQVHTAFAIVLGGCLQPPGEARVLVEDCVTSTVGFRRLEAGEIAAYVASGDPLDKAGAYGLQSGGGALVAEVLGSYLNVVGLPLARLLQALSALGWPGSFVRADEN